MKQCKNQRYSLIKKKVSDSSPSRSSSSLHRWKSAPIYTWVQRLASPQIFSSFFIFQFSLSIVDLLISVLYTQTELSSRYHYKTRPLLLIAACVFWDMVRYCCPAPLTWYSMSLYTGIHEMTGLLPWKHAWVNVIAPLQRGGVKQVIHHKEAMTREVLTMQCFYHHRNYNGFHYKYH